MRVIVLRPEPQAGRMAATLADLGFEVVVAPMLKVIAEPNAVGKVLDHDDVPPGVLVFTSANAVLAMAGDPAADRLLAAQAWTVGPGTAAAARAAGFRTVVEAAGGADALLRRLRAELSDDVAIVHVAGHDRATDIGAALAADGRKARTVTAYRAEVSEHLDEAVARDLAGGRFAIAAVASRRTAEAFDRALQRLPVSLPLPRPALAAISDAAADPLRGALTRIEVASAPNGEALLDTVVALAATLANNETERRS